MSRPGHKRTESADAAALDHLDALSRILNVGLLVLDARGGLEFASPMAIHLLGCRDREELEQRWGDLGSGMRLDDPAPRALSAPLRRIVEVPTGGGVRSLRLEIHPLESESCTGRLVLLKDRRTVDLLETELVLASQMRSLVHVYRVMAHDLKAPLNSMQLTLELLADSLADEDAFSPRAGARERRQRHVAILREELSRLNRSLQSMLEQGEPLGALAHAFDLRELTREIARLLTPQARRQRVELDLQLPGGEVKVAGHRDRLKQALVNVALSGLEGMAGGGRLAIRLDSDDMARLSMHDTGAGATDALLGEVYENHFTREKSRVGTRLYVARLVVESHGGELAMESEPGLGTRIHLALPLATPAGALPAAVPLGARHL